MLLHSELATLWGLDEDQNPGYWFWRSYHMVNDYNLLVDARPSYRVFTSAGSQVLASKAIGNVHISTNTAEVVLKDVLYVPGLNVKLLSTNSLTDEGARVILDSEGGKIHLQTGYTLRVTKNRAKGLLESAARHGDRAMPWQGRQSYSKE